MRAQGKASDRRKHPRKGLMTKVSYSSDGAQYFGRSIDVSEGGMCLETFFAHQVGQQLTIQFRFFERRDPITFVGEIVWLREAGKRSKPMQVLRKRCMGVRFLRVEDKASQSLNCYLDEEILFS